MIERRFVPPALHLCFAVVAAAWLLATAQAAVIVDTFDPGGGFSSSADLAVYVFRVPDSQFASAESADRVNILYAARSAAKFTVPAGSYNLSSITMPIGVNFPPIHGRPPAQTPGARFASRPRLRPASSSRPTGHKDWLWECRGRIHPWPALTYGSASARRRR